jgi:pimeloyl-ACP methyl ester carboxylesterase
MKRCAALLLCLLALVPTSAFADRLGIVLIHGKQGLSGERPLAYLTQQLEGAGFIVDQPDMCWSRTRIYDHALPDCMADIDASIMRLKNSGATDVVVAGHSLGGVGAIYYGSTHDGLKGIVALAPGPGPGIDHQPVIIASLKQAHDLIAAGQGDVVQTFTDYNTNASGTGPITVRATPNIFLSFLDMSGPANLVADAAKLKAPVLWISGTRDPSQLPRQAGFDKVPPNPLNRYEQVDAAHMNTPDKAVDQVVDWLKELTKS